MEEWEGLASLVLRGVYRVVVTYEAKGTAKTEHRHVLEIPTVKVACVTGAAWARGRRAGDELTGTRSLRTC